MNQLLTEVAYRVAGCLLFIILAISVLIIPRRTMLFNLNIMRRAEDKVWNMQHQQEQDILHWRLHHA